MSASWPLRLASVTHGRVYMWLQAEVESQQGWQDWVPSGSNDPPFEVTLLFRALGAYFEDRMEQVLENVLRAVLTTALCETGSQDTAPAFIFLP